MMRGSFYLEKNAVAAMLNSKKSGSAEEIVTEQIEDADFVSLKSLASAVKDGGGAFESSLLSRIAELAALNEEVLSTKSNVVVDRYVPSNHVCK